MNSVQRANFLQVAFFSYLLAALLFHVFPVHRDYITSAALIACPLSCALGIMSRWLFISARCCILCGCLGLAYLHQPPSTVMSRPETQPITFTAVVEGVRQGDDYTVVTLCEIANQQGEPLSAISKLRALSDSGQCDLAVGDAISAVGLAEKKGLWLKVSNFSYRKLHSNKVLVMATIRQAVADKLEAIYQEEELAIARALVLAEKSGLSESITSGYRNFGLLHLLAVSGMHFWLWNAFFLRLLVRPLNKLRIPLLLIASSLAGFGPAVSRAVGFIIMRDLAATKCRNFSSLQLLAIVGLSELLLLPNKSTGLGYLLSYIATAAIIVCCSNQKDNGIIAALRCSWAAFFATMPIIFLMQSTIEIMSIVLSPIFALFTTARLFIILFSLFIPEQPFSNYLLLAISHIENLLISAFDYLPATPWVATTFGLASIFAIAFICLLLASPIVQLIDTTQVLLAVSIVTLIAITPSNPAVGISMVNVGHGLAVVITGSDSSLGFDLGSKTIRPQRLIDSVYYKEMQHNRWPAPEKFIFSHYDDDHVNGIPQLKLRQAVRELDANEIAELRLLPWKILVYRTRGGLNSTANDNGHALDLRYADKRIVVLGDQDGSALFDLARRLDKGPVDVLLSPHHGLSTEGLAMLIEHLRPNEMWASCAPENFPLPAQGITAHYGVPLLHTAFDSLRIIY